MVQRRPSVHCCKAREHASACLPRRHHRCGAGHGRGVAVLSTAAAERVSQRCSVVFSPILDWKTPFGCFARPHQHALLSVVTAATVTAKRCAPYPPPLLATASSSPGRSRPSAGGMALARASVLRLTCWQREQQRVLSAGVHARALLLPLARSQLKLAAAGQHPLPARTLLRRHLLPAVP